jgi:hypothetical protein
MSVPLWVRGDSLPGRICPGLHLADNSVFLAIACMLSVLQFGLPRDAEGRTFEPDVQFDGFIT